MSTTALLIRWSQGYTQAAAAGAIVREEAFFKPGTAVTENEALALADAVLEKESLRKETIDAVVEGAFPVNIGQTLGAPNTSGTSSVWRVMGIAYAQDREGHVVQTPKVELIP